jgi:2,3-bisphosphoglycerate-independent phosphoglycerate mutase
MRQATLGTGKKMTTIERVDEDIVGTIFQGIDNNDNLRIIILPDHPTLVSL